MLKLQHAFESWPKLLIASTMQLNLPATSTIWHILTLIICTSLYLHRPIYQCSAILSEVSTSLGLAQLEGQDSRVWSPHGSTLLPLCTVCTVSFSTPCDACAIQKLRLPVSRRCPTVDRLRWREKEKDRHGLWIIWRPRIQRREFWFDIGHDLFFGSSATCGSRHVNFQSATSDTVSEGNN
jgi:hypothetical protein